MAAPFRVKAVYEYSSPHDDDLNFAVGQIITVTEEEDDDWYSGEYVDDDGAKREGIFPRNFVEKFEPTAPPRPTRTRTKKEPEAAQHPLTEEIAAPPPPLPGREGPAPTRHAEPDTEEADEPVGRSPTVERAVPAVPPSAPPKPAEPAPTPASPPAAPKASEHPAAAPIPVPSSAPKAKPAAPPPAAEKPASNSFRDRIAAFNKPAAPPVAPFKPSGLGGSGGGGGFIKKPFVAPPPSRNAYVPPPREAPSANVYRREEDPEIKEREAENLGQAERAGLVPAEQQPDAGEDDQPKPTSLKERIALLQKQQMEQAQRHAEAAAKKDKPKPKPPKKRTEPVAPADVAAEAAEGPLSPSLERRESEDTGTRTSMDEVHSARAPPPPRRKSSKGHVIESVHDGNEADMSGAGDTTEGQDDTTERDDSDETSRRVSRAPIASTAIAAGGNEGKEGEDDERVEEEEDDVDPEVKRKEELRARMAKMSGGMGFHGMFGAPAPPTAAVPKKKTSKAEAASIAEGEEASSPISRAAPPIPTPMAMPFMGSLRLHHEPTHLEEDEPARPSRGAPPRVPTRPADDADQDEEEEEEATTPAPIPEPKSMSEAGQPSIWHANRDAAPRRDISGPPPLPGGRPAPPPVPSEARPPPPLPPADTKSPTDGSESDDELSVRSPPMPSQALQSPVLPARSPPLSPRPEETSPSHAPTSANKRNSRPPPPIPGSTPVPPPTQGRPPPPPPPGSLSRQSTADNPSAPPVPARPHHGGEEDDEEVTEYEGDYDTDIASSVHHKDALKSHARESSLEDNTLQSPITDTAPNLPPPIPAASAPRAVPPPIPTQPPAGEGSKRRSVDVPRAAPPPPPAKEAPTAQKDDEYDPYSYSALPAASYSHKTPMIEEEAYFPGPSPALSPPDRRAPPAAPGGRARQSLDVQRTSTSIRRSVDLHRPSMESGFIANDVELAVQSGWWKQANQVPPVLQGRKDIHFECEEATSTNKGSKTIVSREVFVLFQDYSQTILSVRYDPYDPSDVELAQRHEPPPRALRQDQMEEFYERFGRHISEAATSKKDGVVADGTPQGLVLELLRPLKDALWPVGTRSYGALVYANMANASTQQNDVIRPGDIMSVRNAKFQGKHGPMHAKYSAEVGKPDHVAVVAEWDGTKKKVRAWEQGRESKKVKMESFKLDDLRSGEVKIWRVVPRSWVGWNSQP
ncbi:SH3 domain-containing protein C23A1.17 [Tolypocladium ophioglossoides CBS 100239]|uniref:SH3 domain-containing protein C23A1.17 n=1 Tax=Tolypocladium ophioglossoides (strain CBS 100239) TaxID=1163406 RepID=A0A0L0NDJ2_TOLOC|nr:SH3 domain-containing protein C23A1.17 [Tolypocladium ophioglossoides CBS 100239]